MLPQVRLRAFTEADDPALRVLFADLETGGWNPEPRADDLPDWRAHHNEVSDEAVGWAVSDAVERRLLGTISIVHVDLDQGDGETGHRVLPGFVELGLRRIQLFHALGNVAWCRVAERADFRVEGHLRQSHRYGDGQVHDEHLHARLVCDPEP